MSGMEMLMIASTAVSAVGAMKQAEGQAAMYEAQARAQQYQAKINQQAQEYNAKVAENQARVADLNAKAAAEQANAKEEMLRRKAAMERGETLAGMAQAGTGFDGTNLDLLRQGDVMAELDALNVRYSGAQEQTSFENAGRNYRSQAELNRWAGERGIEEANYNASIARMNADSAITAGYLNAGSSLLQGATSYTYYGKTGKMAGKSPFSMDGSY